MIQTTNPATNQVTQRFEPLASAQIETKLERAEQAYASWRQTSFKERSRLMRALAQELREKRKFYGALITTEMGCPLAQTIAEIEKCAVIAGLGAEEAPKHLANKTVKTDAKESYVSFEPLGLVLHVAPWNYPFYLALRPVISAIMAGNCVVLKHASNVPQCALALEELFRSSGFPEGVFTTLLIGSGQVEEILRRDSVQMVTLIGSDKAGAAVAEIAGSEVKKSLMELGGADPMIVLPDADIDAVVEAAAYSRLRNAGQSCNAAKRFVVHRSVVEEFTDKLAARVEQEVVGDPLEETTTFGPLATDGSLQSVDKQVSKSVEMGARVVTGGTPLERTGNYYPPTILRDVTEDMPVMSEEVFGPVIPIFACDDVEEAIRIANASPYGLGASIWTADLDLARQLIPRIEAGNVYVNKVVRGNPKLPFGGVKRTGYGREFTEYGLLEFVNIKSVVINDAD